MDPDTPTTLLDHFRRLERMRGVAVVYEDGFRTRRHGYAGMTRAARGFAGTLAARGVRKGDRVVVWSENRPEWLVVYWGCLLAGVVLVPIDSRASLTFLRQVRALVGARLVLAGAHVEGLDPGGEDGEVWWLDDLDWTAPATAPDVPIAPDDLTQIIFTSGATADPKGVLIRHRNVLANLVPVSREIARFTRYARPVLPIRFLNLLPLSHLFGQSLAMHIPPLVDGTVVFMRSMAPYDIARVVKRHRVSAIVCVPKMLDVLKAYALGVDPAAAAEPPGRLSIPARWWRYRRIHRLFGLKCWAFIVGAAPLAPTLEAFWRRVGFAVIQGYGLTETAPIVTMNHPLRTSAGSVGRPIGGVEVRIAEDGEVLVRGENVTSGYFQAAGREAGATEARDAEGWFHTGDLGELDADGRLFIKGRKKEVIVTADGLNVFPDDVEAVLDVQAGVRESAVVGRVRDDAEHVHAVLVVDPGTDIEDVVAAANRALASHQRVQSASVWPQRSLPRTEGTRKLKRAVIRAWVTAGASGPPVAAVEAGDPLLAALARVTGGRAAGASSLDALGLSSLERVELMVALEDAFQTRVDEAGFAEAKSVDDLRRLVREAPAPTQAPAEVVTFPRWNRRALARVIRRVSLATWILPPIRLVARADVSGLEHLRGLDGPVIFAANHQSHLDGPVVLAALPGAWRARVAPATSKEFFHAHFFPGQHTWREVATNRLNYYLGALFFNLFPLPQREIGARDTLRYIGEIVSDGFSILIFPEGVRSRTGEIGTFLGGVGMMASTLGLPVVPVRLDGVDRVLPTGATWPSVGRVSVTFGPAMRLTGDNHAALARRVEEAVRGLPSRA